MMKLMLESGGVWPRLSAKNCPLLPVITRSSASPICLRLLNLAIIISGSQSGVSDGRTSTIIKRLSETERVKEIARMLGGEKITRATLDHAHEMLGKIRTP